MTTVNVAYGLSDPTHDVSLSDGVNTYGLIYYGGPKQLQEIPLSPPAQAFENEQRDWITGRGKIQFDDDNSGYNDDFFLWSTSDERILPSLQWRFAKGLRSNDTSLPVDNSSMAWWKLYGNDPASKVARYLSIAFTASSSYNADKGYLIIRRRGTPGTLTFELCQNNSGNPGTVLQTVTKTTSDITDTVSVFQLFDWSSTQALTSGTVYHIKIYGASSDSSTNYWSILCNAGATTSKYSTDNSSWTTSTVAMYYRIVDADINRQWRFFTLEGMLYACSQNDDGTTSLLKNNGTRGTATAATSTTLTCSALSMTTDQYIGAYIRIFDGLGDGQVRQITANTATQFTVAAWDITPDTTSRFIVYATDYWNTTTGTTGLGAITGKPCEADKIVYFPQGQSVNIRRMRVNASSHDYAADGTNKADLMYTNVEGSATKVYAAAAAAATIKASVTKTWGTALAFGTAYPIGSSQYRITNMYSYNKILQVFKEDGLYTFSNNVVELQGSQFQDVPDPYMGTGVGSNGGYMWFGWNHSLERMMGSSIDDMLNFKRGFEGMPDNRKGVISSVLSAVGWMFVLVDGGASNYSSIMVWNGMGWHEVFRGWATGVRIRNMAWQANIGTRPRLWFDIGGDLAYIEFPLYAANPLRDSGINFNWEGVCVSSTYDAHDPSLYKMLSYLRVYSEAGTAEIDYQTNANVGTNTWTVLGEASTQPVTDITLNLGEVFKIRFRVRLQCTSTRSPCVLRGWLLSGRMMAIRKYQYICTFRTQTDGQTFTSEEDHNPNTLYSQLQTWASQQTRLTMRALSPSADNKTVTVTLPSKVVDYITESDWGGRISVVLLEA